MAQWILICQQNGEVLLKRKTSVDVEALGDVALKQKKETFLPLQVLADTNDGLQILFFQSDARTSGFPDEAKDADIFRQNSQ